MADRPVKITDMSPLAQSMVPVASIQEVVSRSAEALMAFNDSYLGPGTPINTFRGSYPPRQYDYPASVNVQICPNRPYTILKNLASWDPVRYCIERRKGSVKAQKWAIIPENPDEAKNTKYTAAIKELTAYWKRPDAQNGQTFDLWISEVLEQSFLYDASPIMRWPTRSGKGIACHRVIDATTITPKIDSLGNNPLPPSPAYQQVIKGLPLTEYTSDQMLFPIRNPRPDSPYGMSEVEWLLICINIALRRDTSDLLHWTSGNVPYGFGETPENWTPKQIIEWGELWDEMLNGDLGARSKIKWGPKGMNFKTFTDRDKAGEEYKFYEWSSRRACAIFGVAPTAYTGSVNRATAETAETAQSELATEPLNQWIEQLLTTEIQTVQGQPDLCFKYISEQQHNELEQAQTNERRVFSGQASLDTVRNESGEIEIGIPPFIIVPGQGIVYLRGQNPEYTKKYAVFFKDLDEKEAAKQQQAQPGQPGQPLPGQPGQPGDPNAKPAAGLPKGKEKLAPVEPEGPELTAKDFETVKKNVQKQGDVDGHAFHGNQYSGGIGGGAVLGSGAGAVEEVLVGKGLTGSMPDILKLKGEGLNAKQISAKLGLNNKSVSWMLWKHNKVKTALATKIANPAPVTAVAPAKPLPSVVRPKAAAVTAKPATPAATTKPAYDVDNQVASTSANHTWAKNTKTGEYELHYNNSGYTSLSSEAHPPKGYSWAKKTTANSPYMFEANKGKWALFDSKGNQVSGPHDKSDIKGAVNGMNNGQGPIVVKATATTTVKAPAVHVVKDWPIQDDVIRTKGNTYSNTVKDHYKTWMNSLGSDEQLAISGYTGSSYGQMNSYLRGQTGADMQLVKRIDSLQSTLMKAPTPPPPDLVWRACATKGSENFAGKLSTGSVIKMQGFQSTSIEPKFAADWKQTDYVFEIQPAKGAYVNPISSHKSEYEFILPHDASYEVIGRTEVFLGSTKRKVLQLRML